VSNAFGRGVQIVRLPVEFNARRRALGQLQELGLVDATEAGPPSPQQRKTSGTPLPRWSRPGQTRDSAEKSAPYTLTHPATSGRESSRQHPPLAHRGVYGAVVWPANTHQVLRVTSSAAVLDRDAVMHAVGYHVTEGPVVKSILTERVVV
jgi:hypothetical protein